MAADDLKHTTLFSVFSSRYCSQFWLISGRTVVTHHRSAIKRSQKSKCEMTQSHHVLFSSTDFPMTSVFVWHVCGRARKVIFAHFEILLVFPLCHYCFKLPQPGTARHLVRLYTSCTATSVDRKKKKERRRKVKIRATVKWVIRLKSSRRFEDTLGANERKKK